MAIHAINKKLLIKIYKYDKLNKYGKLDSSAPRLKLQCDYACNSCIGGSE